MSNELITDPVVETLPTQKDREFFRRMYQGDLDRYKERLAQIGFKDRRHVLDAGCGFGQWSFAMAQMNNVVTGVDVDRSRIDATRSIASLNKVKNTQFLCANLERLPFRSNTFDAVFSYSTVYFADYSMVFEEFQRVLEEGGRLYLCTNGPGKYLFDILHAPNQSSSYDPRGRAITAMKNAVAKHIGHNIPSGAPRVMSKRGTASALRSAGFSDVEVDGEGSLEPEAPAGKSFYRSTYLGLPRVFEVLARA